MLCFYAPGPGMKICYREALHPQLLNNGNNRSLPRNLLLWKSVAVGRHHDRLGHAHFARNHVVVKPSEGSDPNVTCWAAKSRTVINIMC